VSITSRQSLDITNDGDRLSDMNMTYNYSKMQMRNVLRPLVERDLRGLLFFAVEQRNFIGVPVRFSSAAQR